MYVPELSYPTTKKIYKFKRGYLTKNFRACGVIDTACEFEADFKMTLARESGGIV
jgi:hypothetical protein